MKRVQLKENMYHPKRGRFDFVKVSEEEFQDKGDHVEVISAVSRIKYEIPKCQIAYVSDD